MNITELTNLLNSKVTAARENRIHVSKIILSDNSLFFPLLQITFDIQNKTSIKAAWILEFVLDQNIEWLIPHLPYFTKNISKVRFESVIRPISKICSFLAVSNESNQNIKEHITEEDIQRIIENSFDLLISEQKVAVKVYAMETLFLLGKNEDWIHDELKLIIHKNITKESHAYVARGKRTLLRIKKFENKNR